MRVEVQVLGTAVQSGGQVLEEVYRFSIQW